MDSHNADPIKAKEVPLISTITIIMINKYKLNINSIMFSLTYLSMKSNKLFKD